MPTTPHDLVPSVEAAQILGVDRSTLSRLVAFGTLNYAMKLPGATGAYLFKRSDLETLRDKRDELAAAREAAS